MISFLRTLAFICSILGVYFFPYFFFFFMFIFFIYRQSLCFFFWTRFQFWLFLSFLIFVSALQRFSFFTLEAWIKKNSHSTELGSIEYLNLSNDVIALRMKSTEILWLHHTILRNCLQSFVRRMIQFILNWLNSLKNHADFADTYHYTQILNTPNF